MPRQIKLERLKKGWSCSNVAEKVGVNPETIRLIEMGKRDPSYKILVKLLDLFEYDDPRILFADVTISRKEEP